MLAQDSGAEGIAGREVVVAVGEGLGEAKSDVRSPLRTHQRDELGRITRGVHTDRVTFVLITVAVWSSASGANLAGAPRESVHTGEPPPTRPAERRDLVARGNERR